MRYRARSPPRSPHFDKLLRLEPSPLTPHILQRRFLGLPGRIIPGRLRGLRVALEPPDEALSCWTLREDKVRTDMWILRQ